MTKEIWKQVPGAEDYQVSNLGRVRHVKVTYLKPDPHMRSGHLYVRIIRGKKKVKRGIHQLVAGLFIGPAPSRRHMVLHNDGDPTRNVFDNLRWGTHLENMADRGRHGRHRNGARLTAADVIAIRQSRESAKAIATKYKIHPRHVWVIRKGKAWKNICTDAAVRPHKRCGQEHPGCRLSIADVLAIRASSRPAAELSKTYGVALSHIYGIKDGTRRQNLIDGEMGA